MDEQVSAIINNVTGLLLQSRHSESEKADIRISYDLIVKTAQDFLRYEARCKEAPDKDLYHEAYENYADVFALYQHLVREYRLPKLKLINELYYASV